MPTYYEKRLYGKYQVTMDLPESLKELRWRLGYFRRNMPSWRVLTKSFKPATTNQSEDLEIKNNTLAVLDQLETFYESAATLNPTNPNALQALLFELKKAPFWPSENEVLEIPNNSSQNQGSNEPAVDATRVKHPVYFRKDENDIQVYSGFHRDLQVNTGLPTLADDTMMRDGVNVLKKDALRMQAADPFTDPAAENNIQDIEKCLEAADMIFNSYGSPYTTTRGEQCSRWLFNSRNTAMKAIALVVQECPWLIQAINNFNFFNELVIGAINQMKPNTQLFGHLESPDQTDAEPYFHTHSLYTIDSPRNLLTPLWSDQSNMFNKPLNELEIQGIFNIQYINLSGSAGDPQDLLAIYSNDTYEENAFGTNDAFSHAE